MSGFVDFARAHGVTIDPARLYASERIKRCPTLDHPKSQNGAYFWDGQRGWVWAWDGQAEVQWWNDRGVTPWTEAEKAAWRAKRDASRAQQANNHSRAAQRADEMLRACRSETHDYLALKGLPDLLGLVSQQGDLLVPMRNCITNKLQGVQTIHWEHEARQWTKKMLPGMQARNAVFRIGPKTAQETILCEGYATGLSIELAARQMRLNAAVVICFSDRNMVNVASQTKGRSYIYADNDKSGAGERAAIDTGLPYCMSDTLGNDANDDHAQRGLFYIGQKLMEVRRA